MNEPAQPRGWWAARRHAWVSHVGGDRSEAAGHVAGLLWLLFLGFPISNGLSRYHAPGAKVAVTAPGVLFVAVYFVAYAIDDHDLLKRRWLKPILIVLATDATVLTLIVGSSWGIGMIFVATACAHLLSPWRNLWAVLGCTALVIVSQAIIGAPFGDAMGYASPTLGVGVLMVMLQNLHAKNEELEAARQELAHLAVARERERFARDLHDLLGHTLSVIALKAELAGRLVAVRPEDAAREITEVQEVARTALSEVRDAVSGYRQPMIDDEIAGARVALAAAGVEITCVRGELALEPEAEGVLAWTIREGATNVIRHSCARTCTVTVGRGPDGAFAEVRDDGVGRPDADQASCDGHGLDGLGERATALGGRLDAGPLHAGGFRLAVSVPSVGAG